MFPYEYQTMRSVEDSYWWFTGLRSRVIDGFKRFVDTGTSLRVLDAGCGTGGMMQTLRYHFPAANIIGIDLNSHAVRSTGERNVGGVVNASVNMAPFRDETFDVIISLDVVLEMAAVHDREALLEFNRILKKQGILILNLTAFECLRGQHDAAVTVKYRHTKKTLKPFLLDTGFTIVELSYWNALFFPLLLIWRPISRLFADAANPVSDLTPLPTWLNNLLIWLSLKEMQVARRISPPVGSSIFVIAKKN